MVCLLEVFFVLLHDQLPLFVAVVSAKHRRPPIGSLLSTELITSVIICGAFFMSIRTILGFTRDVGDLRPKLSKLENTLDRVRDGMKDNKDRVGILSKEVNPIQELEGKMRAHYEEMQEIEMEAEKQKIAEEEEEQTGRQRRIQRKKMGFGETESEELA